MQLHYDMGDFLVNNLKNAGLFIIIYDVSVDYNSSDVVDIFNIQK